MSITLDGTNGITTPDVNDITVGRGAGAVATNTAVGASALAANTTGSTNTGIGVQALNNNTTGSNNSAVGLNALYSNSAGNENTAMGRDALALNTTASNNTAVGYQAGYSNTTGIDNTYVGDVAGYGNTGSYNTAMGRFALTTAGAGGYNTATGRSALQANTSGSYNTALGMQALAANTTGVSNTAVGYQAGYNITSGSYNTYIGKNVNGSSVSVTGEIVVSADSSATGKGANTGFVNPGGGGVYQGNNSASWSTTSDQRLKKNIVDNTEGLDKIVAIQVRNFEYRLPEEVTELDPSCAVGRTGVQLGVIAQELQQVCPECVKEESTGVLSVDSDSVFWHMVNAIKELKAEFDAYKASHP